MKVTQVSVYQHAKNVNAVITEDTVIYFVQKVKLITFKVTFLYNYHQTAVMTAAVSYIPTECSQKC